MEEESQDILSVDELMSQSLDIVENEDPTDSLYSQEKFDALTPDVADQTIQTFDVGNSGVGDSQFDRGATLDEIQNGTLDAARAELQPWTHQLGNAVSQAVVGEIVGGSIEALGYILDAGSVIDVMNGEEEDWGNWVTDIGQGIREGIQENAKIYEDPNREKGFFNAMSDSGWWYNNSVSVASTLSMMIPTMAVTRAAAIIGKGLKVSKGLGAVRKAVGMAEEVGTKAKWMQAGLSQAVVSRNMENWMEAHGTFEDHKTSLLEQLNPETGQNFTEEEATKVASKSAAANWKKGWAMIGQDMMQYLSIGKVFNPITRKMEKATVDAARKGIKAGMKPWQTKTLAGLNTFASEGGEEAYQYYISEQSKLKSDLRAGLITEEEYDERVADTIGSEEMMTSAFFGALGGGLFQAAGGPVGDAFKGKDKKKYEAELASNYTQRLKAKVAHSQAINNVMADADQKGYSQARKDAIDHQMMQMTVDALEADKFDQFIEGLEGIPNMSQEEIAELEKQEIEYNPEIAKKYTPELVKMANGMRDKYLKHRNTQDSHTSAVIAELETRKERLTTAKNENKKSIEESRSKMGEAWTKNATNLQKEIWEAQERKTIAHNRLKSLKAERAQTGSKSLKAMYDKVIAKTEKELKDVREEIKNSKAQQTTQRKETPDNESAQTAYDAVQDEILKSKETDAKIEDDIILTDARIVDAKSPEFQTRRKVNEKMNEIDSMTTVDQAEKALKDLDKEQSSEGEQDVDRNTILTMTKEKLAILKAEETAEKNKGISDKHKEEVEAINNQDNADPKTADNQAKGEIDLDHLEDIDADEEITQTAKVLNEADAKTDIDAKEYLPLLDKVVDSPGYKDFKNWMENPVSKIDKEFEYSVAPLHPESSVYEINAWKTFNTATDVSELDNSVFDNLPIKATLVGSDGLIYTFLPTTYMSKMNSRTNINPQQRSIIANRLKMGLPVIAKVKAGSGGDLNLAPSPETGQSAQNSIADIPQVKAMIERGEELQLLVSNKEGYLVNTDKEKDADLGHTFMTSNKDKYTNDKPYRGGVYLKVRKANGDWFPLKLNMLRNTEEQAAILTEILMDVAVPNMVGDKLVKKYKLNSPVSSLSDELQEDISKHMASEMEMLDPEYKDPTIKDLLNAFVYTSEKTHKYTSRLYMKGNDLFFGEDNRLNPSYKNGPHGGEIIDKLLKFLTTKKRRQFSLKMFNSNPAYQKWAIDNHIISTNASTKGPLFSNTKKKGADGGMTGRRIQIFMEQLPDPSTGRVTVDNSGKAQIPQSTETTIVSNTSELKPKEEDTIQIPQIPEGEPTANTIEYTPPGQKRGVYTVNNGVIKNSKGKEVYKTPSVNRNKILANVEVKNFPGSRIEIKKKVNGKEVINKYVVLDDLSVVSEVSGKIMKHKGIVKDVMEKYHGKTMVKDTLESEKNVVPSPIPEPKVSSQTSLTFADRVEDIKKDRSDDNYDDISFEDSDIKFNNYNASSPVDEQDDGEQKKNCDGIKDAPF